MLSAGVGAFTRDETGFINYYHHLDCPVDPGVEWEDEWSSTCNAECPACGAEVEPYKSEDSED